MHQFTTVELAAVGTFLVTLGGVISQILTRIVDNWVKVRRRKMEDRFDVQKIDLLEDKQLQDGLKFAIKKQDRQITDLQRQVDNLTVRLMDCVRDHATAQTERNSLAEQLDQALKTLAEYRTEMRRNRVEDQQTEGRRRQFDPPSPPRIGGPGGINE